MALDRNEVLARLQGVFHDTFADDSLVVTESTKSADIEDWDSLANVRLMIAVEQAFGVRTKAPEVASLKHVGDLISLVISKKG